MCVVCTTQSTECFPSQWHLLIHSEIFENCVYFLFTSIEIGFRLLSSFFSSSQVHVLSCCFYVPYTFITYTEFSTQFFFLSIVISAFSYFKTSLFVRYFHSAFYDIKCTGWEERLTQITYPNPDPDIKIKLCMIHLLIQMEDEKIWW